MQNIEDDLGNVYIKFVNDYFLNEDLFQNFSKWQLFTLKKSLWLTMHIGFVFFYVILSPVIIIGLLILQNINWQITLLALLLFSISVGLIFKLLGWHKNFLENRGLFLIYGRRVVLDFRIGDRFSPAFSERVTLVDQISEDHSKYGWDLDLYDNLRMFAFAKDIDKGTLITPSQDLTHFHWNKNKESYNHQEYLRNEELAGYLSTHRGFLMRSGGTKTLELTWGLMLWLTYLGMKLFYEIDPALSGNYILQNVIGFGLIVLGMAYPNNLPDEDDIDAIVEFEKKQKGRNSNIWKLRVEG